MTLGTWKPSPDLLGPLTTDETLAAEQELRRQAEARAATAEASLARMETAQAKLSAVAALIQNPTLSHKLGHQIPAVLLALEAQRPRDDPNGAFKVNLGELAKQSGLVPPTARGDDDARDRAWDSGRKEAGQIIKLLNEADVICERSQRKDQYDRDKSSVVLRIDIPHLEMFHRANKIGGTRKLQEARHHNGSQPLCDNCGPAARVVLRKNWVCSGCGQYVASRNLDPTLDGAGEEELP